jgi:serine/threonine-protein kinase
MTDLLDRLGTALADRYTIERELGAGGMATVYLAQDLRHDRKVAIKVLRPELAAVIGADRFLSEIKTTANLQHPHILPLFDSGAADSFLFYVMPYVEGESLRDRITREHQLPVADAVRLATEIAGALDYAHRHGVIHRDIKPENVMLHDGQALVADFGIALAMANTAGTRMTETGMSLGTPHYMSPEQAMGEREITGRSDVYALGAITYEMLCGEPPFTGPTAQAIIARVMTEEPRGLVVQRKSIPPAVEGAVRQALEKLPADRFATAAEFAAALKDPTATSYRTAATPVAVGLGRRGWLLGAAATALALAVGWAIGRSGPTSASNDVGVVRAALVLGDSVSVYPVLNSRLAISADGRRVVFVGRDGERIGLMVKELAGGDARYLEGTDNGFAPFFSPDGGQVGYLVGPNNAADLKVVATEGGVVRTLVRAEASAFGASWGDDGRIYYSAKHLGIASVPATGGAPVHHSTPDSANQVTEHDYPLVLPGSRHALLTLWKGTAASAAVGVVDLSDGSVVELAPGSFARYLDPGFVLIGSTDGRVTAMRFDPTSGTPLGDPTLVLERVDRETSNGTVQFAVSRTGTLVFQPAARAGDQVVWVDSTGATEPIDTNLTGAIRNPAVSPDGRRIALSYSPGAVAEVWIKDLTNGSVSKISSGISDGDRPAWQPDGNRIAYLADLDSRHRIFTRRADGSDEQRPMLGNAEQSDEITYDPTGRHAVIRTRGTEVGTRWLRILELGVDSTARDLLPRRAYDRFAPTISADGRWLAYVSTETGTSQVMVRPFPNVDSARFAISQTGGAEPRWSRDGTNLYFRDLRGHIHAARTTLSPVFRHDSPRPLFDASGFFSDGYHQGYDVHPDGRFVMVQTSGTGTQTLDLVLNWRKELETIGISGP